MLRRCAHSFVGRGPITSFKKCRFQAALVRIESPADVAAGLAEVLEEKKVAKASHPTMHAWRCGDGAVGFDDDGEGGSGRFLLKVLEDAGRTGELLVVTRWYGGSHLGGARWRIIRKTATALLAEVGESRGGAEGQGEEAEGRRSGSRRGGKGKRRG